MKKLEVRHWHRKKKIHKVFIQVWEGLGRFFFFRSTSYDCFSWVPQCFFTPKCHRDQAAASALVHNVSERLASHHSVRCFVDPTERAYSAILRRVYDRAAVFHSLFWPTCTLIGGSAIIAMVKLTQYLSIVSERLRRIKTWRSGKDLSSGGRFLEVRGSEEGS